MAHENEAQPEKTPSRRRLAMNAEWETPVALASTSAPVTAAFAPEIGGSASIQSSCSGTTQTLTVNGTSAYPTHGIWISLVPASPTPTATSLTVYLSTTFGTLTWTRLATGSTAWSVPSRDTTVPAISGFTAYTTRYSGAWSYDTGNRRLYNTARPSFQAIRSGATCVNPVTIYSRRQITLSGRTYTLQRGPSNLA